MRSLFGGYNEGQWLFLGNWGPLWLTAFLLIAAALLVLTWLDVRELPPWRRRALVGLRGLVLALGILLAAEPALELRDVSRVPNHVAVLFDASASGQLPADGRRDRQAVLRAQADALPKRDALPKHRFDLFTFGADLRPSTVDALRALRTDAPKTDILGALEAVGDRYAADALGGIALLSDGADNATLARRVPEGSTLDATTLQALTRLRVPIHTVAIAENDKIRDVAIAAVRHDEFAFVRNAVSVDVDIDVHGYSSGRIPVALRRNGELLQTQFADLEPGKTTYRLQFEFVPELIGKEVYSVDTPVAADDAVPQNNRDFFVLRVIRDKIRVLQVVGEPSWDVRFLRQFLKGDPNVELISFFILRSFEDIQRAPESEMSLIPFPTEELFKEQLGSFDLIILQNFSYEPFGMRQYLPNIRDYVKRGGGLLVIGGEQSLSAGGYASSPLEDVLPVTIPPAGVRSQVIDDRSFQLQLSDAGRRHPITRLEFDPRTNLETWNSLPANKGSNILWKPKPGAVVLATHPQRRESGAPMPVLVVGDQEKGRSMVLGVDGSWRWNFERVLEGGTSRPYSAFWNSAIRWLIRDPALNLLQIDSGANVVAPDSIVDVQFRAFRGDYSPAPHQDIELVLYRQSLDDMLVGGNKEEQIDATTVTTDEQGRARWAIPTEGSAAWRIEASAQIDDNLRETASDIVLSVDRSDELRMIQARNELLRALSDATGGRHLRAPADLSSLSYLEPTEQEVNRRHTVDLWSTPWALLLLVGLLVSEWQLRRRWGRL